MALMGNPNSSIGEASSVQSPNLSIGETASDLDLSGKRKEGNEIQEIDSGVAKGMESRQVSEFAEDISGLLYNFKQELTFERENFDIMRDYFTIDDTEFIELMRRSPPYDHQAVLKHISQVRNSGGFDVDVKLPSFLDALICFIPLDLSEDKNEFTDDSDCDDANHQIPTDREYATERAKFAIDEINADMNTKTFELVEVVKAVETRYRSAFMFLTLTVKKVGKEAEEAATITIQAIVFDPWDAPMELKEWRFKP